MECVAPELYSKCAVCLENVGSSRDLEINATCGHKIHPTCLEVLLECGENSCPMCGQSLINNERMNVEQEKSRLVLAKQAPTTEPETEILATDTLLQPNGAKCMSPESDSKCPVCLEDVGRDFGIVTRCGHMIHHTCFEVLLECGEHNCPVCGQLEFDIAELRSPISTVRVPNNGSSNHIVAPPSNITNPTSLNEHHYRSAAIDTASLSQTELQLGDVSNEVDVDFLCPKCNSEIVVFNNDMDFSLDLHCQTLIHLTQSNHLREHRTSISNSLFTTEYKQKSSRSKKKSVKENTPVNPKTSRQTLPESNVFVAALQYLQPTSHKRNLKTATKPPTYKTIDVAPFIPETSTTGPSKPLTQQRDRPFHPRHKDNGTFKTIDAATVRPFHPRDQHNGTIKKTIATATDHSKHAKDQHTGPSKRSNQSRIAPVISNTSGKTLPESKVFFPSVSNTIHSVPELVANGVSNSNKSNLEKIFGSLPKELCVSKNDFLYKKHHVVCLLCSCKVPLSNKLQQSNLITHVLGDRHKSKCLKT